ncbi:MAG TPA: hypothetical protein DIU11_08100, partial [Pusillimonas sp.]|nr:hypothetical protein [Pusillimonas sp.]
MPDPWVRHATLLLCVLHRVVFVIALVLILGHIIGWHVLAAIFLIARLFVAIVLRLVMVHFVFITTVVYIGFQIVLFTLLSRWQVTFCVVGSRLLRQRRTRTEC